MKRLTFSQHSFQRGKDCIIRNCKELTSIVFDDYSFHELPGVFELSNLPNLHHLDIGNIPREKVRIQRIDSRIRLMKCLIMDRCSQVGDFQIRTISINQSQCIHAGWIAQFGESDYW